MLTLCYEIPSFDPMNARLEAEGKRNRWLFANPEKLGNHLMKNASDLYQKVACDRSVIKNSILAKLIKTLLPFWDMKVNIHFLVFFHAEQQLFDACQLFHPMKMTQIHQ